MTRTRGGSLGPAIIVASVVLGPGSILTASRVGCDFAFGLLWVPVLAALLMIAMTALSARLGVMLPGTPCDEIARHAGRPVAAIVGLVLFLVVACFQFSNNIAVFAALQPYAAGADSWLGAALPTVVLVAVNAGVIAALYGLRRLYRPFEVLMKCLVLVMILGFLGNVILSQPPVVEVLAGLFPTLPDSLSGSLLPEATADGIRDPFLPVQALIVTTFSVAGAFYQAYLVRQKGWTSAHLRRGLVDSIVGIGILGILTLTILVTAATVLHGKVEGESLGSATQVAAQLEPLFGSFARHLFNVGLLAGAISSFLVNAMIGGTVMADGLGLGGDMDRPWPKHFTTAALMVGMVVAILSLDARPVRLVIFAQALTVLGNPILAAAILWLSLRTGAPRWLRLIGVLGFLLVLALAARTALRIWLQFP